ncbi:hypothetical protein GQX74_008275 [Glossina fuscipes]|nr:hypothetical protein GQX74_008275 [Glossina fuscipes]
MSQQNFPVCPTDIHKCLLKLSLHISSLIRTTRHSTMTLYHRKQHGAKLVNIPNGQKKKAETTTAATNISDSIKHNLWTTIPKQPGNISCNGPISTEHCDWLYGIFGHETSCTRYWTCWNGTATEQLCIGGLLYNENAHSCDWPENVDGCQKHPLCNDDANGNVPLGKSCNRYWQCQGGYPRLQRCPAMLVFDRHSLRCVVPPTEECDIPTTPLPLDGEIENNTSICRAFRGSHLFEETLYLCRIYAAIDCPLHIIHIYESLLMPYD